MLNCSGVRVHHPRELRQFCCRKKSRNADRLRSNSEMADDVFSSQLCQMHDKNNHKKPTYLSSGLVRRRRRTEEMLVPSSPCENRLLSRCLPGLIANRLNFMLMSADISLNSLHSIKERSKGPKSRLFSQAILSVKFKHDCHSKHVNAQSKFIGGGGRPAHTFH